MPETKEEQRTPVSTQDWKEIHDCGATYSGVTKLSLIEKIRKYFKTK